MGGVGSGRWYRLDKKQALEEIHNVDVRFLKRKGYLMPGVSGVLSWNCGGIKTGRVNFKMFSDRIELSYRIRAFNEEWNSRVDSIYFDTTNCHFGGERLWLLCPKCDKRVVAVYGLTKGFLCRKCYGLTYSSQSEGGFDRVLRKLRKLELVLGDVDNKPKGMHWKTFYPLSEEYRELESLLDGYL